MRTPSARAPRRGFVWALVGSLVLHGVTLGWLPAPPRFAADRFEPAAPPPIAVHLLPPPAISPAAVPPVAPMPVAPPAARPRRAQAVPDAPPAPPALPATTSAAPAAAEPPVPAASGGTAPDATAAASAAETGPAAASAPELRSAPEPAVPAADAEPPPGSIRFPRSGRVEYAVTVGTPPTLIGRATYAWEASETAYRLSLAAETTGLVGLIRRVRIVQMSEGRITPDGLRPDAFTMDRGPGARNEFARFDWTAKQLTFGYPDAVQTAALAAGAQDTLSLILQFAFVPIVEGERQVVLTTGRKLYVQSYERVAEDVIETPAGAWRAWHLRRVRQQADDEGYDMWLATDRPFLPVRIRWTDRKGRVTSATVDTVRLSPD